MRLNSQFPSSGPSIHSPENFGDSTNTFNPCSGIFITLAFAIVSLILIVTEIILFAKRKLLPVTYLVFQVVMFTLWLIVFLIDLVVSAAVQAAYSPIELLYGLGQKGIVV